MKGIGMKFMGMGVVLLLLGLWLRRPLMLFAGLAFIIYSFFSKGMPRPKDNIFKPRPISKKK